MIEPLEARIAPATLAGKVLTYADVDGDRVTVTFSKGALDFGMFTFDVATTNGDNTVPQQLQLIDISAAAGIGGAAITFHVVKAGSGDGQANVGRINAGANNLGQVLVKGDLGVIDVGSGGGVALKSLSVRSMGAFNLSTQGGLGDLQSDINGTLGALKVVGDVRHAFISVSDSVGANGKIGAVTIGGSLIGGTDDNSGAIIARDGFGRVTIKGDMIGGRGTTSGVIACTNDLAGVTVGGSITGGEGPSSGVIFSGAGKVGPVKIGGDLVGGVAASTGRIFAKTTLASVIVSGSVLGGAGGDSGKIHSDGAIGLVKIGGDIVGSSGSNGGGIFAQTTLAGVAVGGSLLGGSNTNSGVISSVGDMGPVTIGGNVQGGLAPASNFPFPTGFIRSSAGKIASVSISGSLIGGAGATSGAISSAGDLGPVKVGHDVKGGLGIESGFIQSMNGKISSVTIGGSLVGGDVPAQSFPGMFADFSGRIQSHGDLGPVKIAGDVQAGSGFGSGFISSAAGKAASITIGGSIINGGVFSTGDMGPVKVGHDVTGSIRAGSSSMPVTISKIASVSIGGSLVGKTTFSGIIVSTGDMGAVKIGGDLRGGSISGTQTTMDRSGYVESGGRIASVNIGGSIIVGFDGSTNGDLTKNASIRAGNDIGPITIKGSIIGNEASAGLTFSIISARGQEALAPGATSDIAIKSLTVGGRVELAKVLAGFRPDDTDTTGSNGNASIGAVKVGGDWWASSISAGVRDGGSDGFGTNDDVVIDNPPGAALDAVIARIASITIRGAVIGAPNPFFQTGFVAQQVGVFKAAGFMAPLTPGTDAPILLTPYTANVTLREV